jgi:hypothetical protein
LNAKRDMLLLAQVSPTLFFFFFVCLITTLLSIKAENFTFILTKSHTIL